VQFIVTTHSPLVLSSFDRAEIVMLDRASEGGIRTLDRQIFAFSTDQVYDWLMGTPPQSTVLDEKLKEGTDPNLPLYLYQSKEKSEEQAKEELEEIRALREKLLDPAS
jgi:predicted ATP-binding protein involved in virulence